MEINPAVQDLRQTFGADIVVMLTNANGTLAGKANSLDPLTENKVAVVQVTKFGSSHYILAHEIAHHFGCLHQNPIMNNEGCPHAKILYFDKDNEKETVVVADKHLN